MTMYNKVQYTIACPGWFNREKNHLPVCWGPSALKSEFNSTCQAHDIAGVDLRLKCLQDR
jgi:hypothetical protein